MLAGCGGCRKRRKRQSFGQEKIMLLFRFAAAMILLLCSASHGFAGNWPPTAADISVTLARANGGCLAGNDCRLAIQLENLGNAPFKGGLRVVIETAAPSVPGFVGSENSPCERLAYGRIACQASSIELAPSQTLTGFLSVRFLPTHMTEVEACASIDWRGTTGTATKDAVRSVAAALGKDAPAGGDAAALLSAVFGTWGEGDLRRGNDRGCVTIAIGPASAEAACPFGQERIAGNCVVLDDFCSGNRKRDATTGNCACPTAAEVFHPVSRVCAAAAAPSCSGGRTAKDGLCFCPEERPLWNGDRSSCEEWRRLEPERATVEVETPSTPAPKPKVKVPVETVNAPVKKADAPVIKRIVAKPSCGRDEVLRDGTCVKVAGETTRKPNAIHVARQVQAKPDPVWISEANRCPPIFAFCWLKVIHEYRKHKRQAHGQ
jgi:hypothetical protein